MDHQTIYSEPRGASWLANAAAYYLEKAGSAIEFISDQFREIRKPDDCRTPQELRDYAMSIQHTQPGFAHDLIAAANRAEGID